MADNVPITAGSGTNIATDDAGAGGHVQVVKLAISTDGSATPIPAEATNGLDVDVTRLPASTNTLEVVGDVAHDAAVAGNPVLQGGEARTTNPTAVADGDAVRAMNDDLGRRVVVAGQVRDLIVDQTTTITSSTSETTILTAAASTFHDMTAIMLINTSATATRVDIRDDTAGTIRFSFYLPAGDTRGMVLSRPRPQTAVNKNWTAQCGTSVDGVRIWIQAEKNV